MKFVGKPKKAYVCGEPLPARLGPADMMWLFGTPVPDKVGFVYPLRKSRFYELIGAGRFDRFRPKHEPNTQRNVWSGALVREHFEQSRELARAV